jgi:hypothetical protein
MENKMEKDWENNSNIATDFIMFENHNGKPLARKTKKSKYFITMMPYTYRLSCMINEPKKKIERNNKTRCFGYQIIFQFTLTVLTMAITDYRFT